MQRFVPTALLALVLIVAIAHAQAPMPTPSNTPPPTPRPSTQRPPTPTPKAAEMTWQAWVAVATVAVLILTLMLNLVSCLAAMVLSTLFLYLVEIITMKDLYAGFSNNGLITIALLFICVDPIAELPAVKQLVARALGGSEGSPSWARFKIVVMCLGTSWFLNNIPQVAVLTNLVKAHCREHGQFPSMYLMPMDFATLVGNYAVIGTSTNIIVSGIMENNRLGSMAFFELAKINGPFFVVAVLYLTFAGHWLLPQDRGGMFRLAAGAKGFLTRLRIEAGSRLIGRKIAELPRELPESYAKVEILQLDRGAASIRPLSGQEVLEEGDTLLVNADASSIAVTAKIIGATLQPVTLIGAGAVHARRSEAEVNDREPFAAPSSATMGPQAAPGEGTPVVVTVTGDGTTAATPSDATIVAPRAAVRGGTPRTGTPRFPRGASSHTLGGGRTLTPRDPNANGSFALIGNEGGGGAAAPSMGHSFHEQEMDRHSFATIGAANVASREMVSANHTDIFEAVLGPKCVCLGMSVGLGGFQMHYACSILAVRPSATNDDLHSDRLANHVLQVGDTVLVLANANFLSAHREGSHFISCNSGSGESEQDAIGEAYVRVPGWFPFGRTLAHVSDHKLVPVPFWYKYLIVPVFIAMVSVAAAGWAELVTAALCSVCFLCLIGITNIQRAVAAIELDVIIMVAFSFGLGSAMEKSGFAAVIGDAIRDSSLEGIGLLYVVGAVSLLLGNLVSDKAAVQVLIPIVIRMFRARGLDPLGGIMLSLTLSTQGLCTPYGFATNLIVMGPGGYEPKHFTIFGFPLNVIGLAVFPLLTHAIYYA